MKIKPLLLFFLLTTVTISAQNTRYVDEVFDSVVVLPENIYSLNIDILTSPPSLDSLRFDLYMPAGDTATNRPLVVVLHTGTFLPKGFVAASGDKNDYANIESCKRLARMGYVAASINYRVGWNPQAPSDVERRAGILNAAFRSIQDMYTYIRFMDMTVQDQGNPFRVDPDKVAIFGIGTGGFLGINAAVLDKWREEIYIDKFRNPVNGTPFIDTNLVGVITGERMAPLCVANWVGYSNDFHFAMGLDGAAGDSSWMETGDVTVPIVCAGVVSHPTTPFGIDPITGEINCDLPVFTGSSTGLFVVNIAGSACLIDKANSLGYNDTLNKFIWDDPISESIANNNFAQEHLWAINLPGFQTGPWEYWDSTFWKLVPFPGPDFDNIHEAGLATNPDMSLEKANAHIDTAMWMFGPRACIAMGLGDCGDITSGLEDLVESEYDFKVAPNPAYGEVTLSISGDERITAVLIFDMFGRVVRSANNIDNYQYTFDVGDLAPGMYGVKARIGNKGFLSSKLVVQH